MLVAAAARKLEVSADDVEWNGESCRVAGTDRELGYKEVVTEALREAGTLTVKGTWSTPPETQGGKFRGAAVGS
ncbi:MAG: molybdopterin-dependent oxidoreductase, partial [Burkholderiales bacterium]|nr:molybdopterin-dependent oxidoreductase [Burkholderiales bacterium]